VKTTHARIQHEIAILNLHAHLLIVVKKVFVCKNMYML
jgi:hypothetical protein